MVISSGLLVIKRVFKLPFSPYYPTGQFWFQPKILFQNGGPPGVSNPQGGGGALFRRHGVDWTRGGYLGPYKSL